MIDIVKDEFRPYQEKLYKALANKDELIAPSVVFAEMMPQFEGNIKLLRSFFIEHKIKIEALDIEAVTIAAMRWMQFLTKKTKKLCPKCGYALTFKEHFLSDFYIGGFALAKCDSILTRDRGIYKKYFTDLPGYENCLNEMM